MRCNYRDLNQSPFFRARNPWCDDHLPTTSDTMESAETDYLNETRVRLPPRTCLVDLPVRGTNRTIYYLYSLILYWLEYIVHPFPHFMELGGGDHDLPTRSSNSSGSYHGGIVHPKQRGRADRKSSVSGALEFLNGPEMNFSPSWFERDSSVTTLMQSREHPLSEGLFELRWHILVILDR